MARRTKKIDYTHWTGFSGSTLVFSAGVVGLTVATAAHQPETLLRTRGEIVVYPDATQGPGALAVIDVGMILVPEGTGTTVLWSPRTDADAPWLWYGSYHAVYEEMVTDVIAAQDVVIRDVIDSRAMRIVRNQEIQLVWENTTIGGAVTVNSAVSGRFLTGH